MKEARLEKHHKIPRCLGKIFPRCTELKRTIKSPENIKLLTPEEHKAEHVDTNEMLKFLRKEFKGRKAVETTIFRSDLL